MNALVKSIQNLTIGNIVLKPYNLPYPVKWQNSLFHNTPVVCAEPMRKKKRLDPTILKERAEKKIRRIERDIRKLEKVAKKYKPISELEVPRKLYRDSDFKRSEAVLTETEMIERIQLKHEWAVYKRKEHVAEMNVLQRIVNAQENALDALQEASPELYEEALQADPSFIPFKMKGPVETPPIENYNYPDGDYIDITKEYQPIIPADPKKQKKLGLLKKN